MEKMNQIDRVCSGACMDADRNCSVLGADGLPLQCVGPWAEDKYSFLERYLTATRWARKKYSDNGNSVFVDLFAGPGLCVVRNRGNVIENGILRVIRHQEVPFSEYRCFDVVPENADALRKRTGDRADCFVECRDSNDAIVPLVRELLRKPFRYHFAYLDPFGPEALPFSTVAELAKLDRLDLFLHFPSGTIRRNLPAWEIGASPALDIFMGTDTWRAKLASLPKGDKLGVLVEMYKQQIVEAGFPEQNLKMAEAGERHLETVSVASVKNTVDVELYVIILASKHEVGLKIWNSVLMIEPSGQRKLF